MLSEESHYADPACSWPTQTTLFGGIQLPANPPNEDEDGWINYPTSHLGYSGQAGTWIYGIPIPCIQRIALGISCPNQTLIDMYNDDTCLVMANGVQNEKKHPDDPGYCLGYIELCGMGGTY